MEQEPSKPATDANEPSSSVGKPIVEEEQQPGLISQLVAARKSNKTKRVHRSGSVSSNEQILEDVGTPQLLEEPDTTQWGLKVIKRQPPREADAVDIIAIHGLGGNWDTTWTDPKTGVNWLKSLLVEDIPKARIMSYGYNSKEYFSKSNANIQDFALDLLVDYKSYRTSVAEKSRPVIFLCHSLGGIVFKQVSCVDKDVMSGTDKIGTHPGPRGSRILEYSRTHFWRHLLRHSTSGRKFGQMELHRNEHSEGSESEYQYKCHFQGP